MNKLIRTVKNQDTAKKLVDGKERTAFKVTTHGYYESGEKKGQVHQNIIQDWCFEVYEGVFYEYQRELRKNQIAKRIA